jgi:hypothetical protein
MQGRATLAGQIGVRAGSQNVDLLVVDPATFADGADLTAAQVGLLDDLVPTGAGEPAAALVVGPLPEPVLRLANDRTLAITPVATPAVFPTLKRAATLVVVRRDAVPPELGLAGLVLAHGDPEAVETALRADGRLVTGVTSPDEVVSAVSYSAVRWAYGTLQAFGGLVVVVLVGVELSVAAARAPLRRLAEVLTAAMGLGRRRALAAVVLEHGAPLAVGAGVGVAVARAVASIAVPHLDSARTIPPGAVALVPASAVVAVLAVGTAAVALAATTSRLTARRARPVEVLRGG